MPVGRGEVHPPKVRSGGQELEADAQTFFAILTKEYDAAFLFFLREGIREDEHHSSFYLLLKVDQSAVRIDHNGLAGLAEFAALKVLSRHNYSNAHEDARAAPGSLVYDLRHNKNMVE